MEERTRSDRTQTPWLRIWLEGVVIVGSILLAFGIDAAWDGREERQRRNALLAAVGSDMTRAREEVERVLRFHSTGQSAAAELHPRLRPRRTLGSIIGRDGPQELVRERQVRPSEWAYAAP